MSNDEITNMLMIILAVMGSVLMVLVVVFLILLAKSKKGKKTTTQQIELDKDKGKNKNAVNQTTYNKQSIFSFLEFDKIEDNMIVRKNGNNFLMVIECQGVNYDLMSGLEKNSVEQGFMQFLNTIRYPIQLYVQTRTVNLESGILRYKDRVNNIKDRLAKKQMEYAKKESLQYSKEELNKARLEVTRERNLYEYGLDIINSTQRMSLNRNILRKYYYVIIDYTPEDINNLSKEEISGMAFSELYTKAQNIINSLAVCGVNGKVLNSSELVELLYAAYNRDEAEVYDLEKAVRAGYDEMYTTAPNVLEKRMKEIDKKIEVDAQRLANDLVMEAMEEREEEKRVREKEAEMDALIEQMAKIIIKENANIVGEDLAERATEKIEKKKRGRKPKEEKDEEK